MYEIAVREWGFRLTFGGNIDAAEMTKWYKQTKEALQGRSRPFGVFVDMRELTPLAPDVQEIMVKGQQEYKKAGMERSCVIVNNAVTLMQFRKLAIDSGIYDWERYVASASTENWEEVGMAWVRDAVDPDA